MLKKLILLIYIALIIFYFLTPFVGAYGHSHLQFSIAARNILENKTLVPFVWPGQTYLNHPPLLYWFLAIGYGLFGFSEFIGRIIPFLFSLGSAIFFYKLVKKYFGDQTAKYSLFSYLTFPMFLFYGAFIQFEPLVLFFSLGSLYFLEKYLAGKSVVFFALATCFMLLATLSDFSGLIFTGLLIIYLLIRKHYFLSLIFIILTSFFLILYYSYLTSSGFSIQNLIAAYTNRAGTFSFLMFFQLIIITLFRLVIYFSPVIFVQFLILNFKFLINFRIFKFLNKNLLVIILLAFPLLNILSLPSGSATHPYFIFFFIPIMALFCGLLFERAKRVENFSTVIPDLIWNLFNRFRLSHKKDVLGRNDKEGCFLHFLLITPVIFSLLIFSLKIYQIRKFSWQYDIAKKTAEIIGKNTIFYKNWALDKELFYWYNKNLSIEIYPEKLLTLKNYQANYYLFTCFPQCHNSDHQFLKDLSEKYTWQKIETDVPTYIFNLNKKPKKENLITLTEKIIYGKQIKIIEGIKKLFRIEQL